MTWALAAILAAQTSEDTYTMRVYLKAEQKGNDVHWLKRAFADYDGIKNIQYDNNYDVLILTMESDTVLNQAQLKEALPDRYTIVKIELVNLVGRVKQNKSELSFTLPAAGATLELEKWSEQPQWFEYILKHASEAEGFRIKARLESSGPSRPLQRPNQKLVVLHAEMCKLKGKAAAAGVKDVTLKFHVDEVDAKEGKSLAESAKSVKGVTWTEFDAEGGILIATVKGDAAWQVKDFEKLVSKKGKLVKVSIEGLVGTLQKDGAHEALKARGTGKVYRLEFNRPSGKFGRGLMELLGKKEGTDVRVSGELIEGGEAPTIQVTNIRPAE
jgi:hypothetical protein